MAALALSLPPAAAAAQTVVTSARPDRVAVTVYRDPDRAADTAPNLQWLNGYALISETRRISVPAGESTIRFEGVAGGIVPQTAIVGGFPEGIVERNRDAYLLSPATILDRSLGRRVHIRRTSGATGAVREQEAIIRSSADGAVVLQTPEGFEALRCTGLPETILYGGVPPELSPTPTLSVRTRSTQAVTATVTLSYIATGFDWQANYIAQLSSDGTRADLFAWLTLASTDETSFADADAQAVAGGVNYARTDPEPREGGPLSLQCWPAATTSDIPLQEWQRMAMGRGQARGMVSGYGDSIVVTGTRVRQSNLESVSPITAVSAAEIARQESLGDLKLYRIPIPVTVAANSQKQVALMVQPQVRIELVYRQRLYPPQIGDPVPVPLFLVTRNRTEEGLGLPLPSGQIALFADHGGRPMLLGESNVYDRAVGEDVEIQFPASPGVRTQTEMVRKDRRWREYRLTVTNDRPAPIRFEAEFPGAQAEFRPSRRLPRRDGFPYWATTVPPNGSATFLYRLADSPPR
jgi:hypothetical protein